MPANDLISVPDYNNIRTAIIEVVGTGAASYGYGQSIQSSAVASSNLVSKTEWDNLRFDIVNAIVHQTGSLPSMNAPAEGELIRYGASVPNFQYNTLATQARTNRFDIAAGQYVTEAGLSSGSIPVTFSSYAQNSFTITFSTANDARYFFNSGGKIRFSSSFTVGASPTSQDYSWRDLLLGAGTIAFGGNTYYTLTSSDTTFSTISGSSTYSANKWLLKARCNVANNSTGTATSITFTSRWQDDYVDSYPDPSVLPYDRANGSLSLTVNHIRAAGALYPQLVANSFAIAAPVYGTLSSISYS